MPSSVVGGAALRNAALNCSPWARSLTQVPEAWTNSPAVIDGRRADHGHQLALAADLDPQHTEPVLGVVVGHPLDQPGQRLARNLGRWCGLRRHGSSLADQQTGRKPDESAWHRWWAARSLGEAAPASAAVGHDRGQVRDGVCTLRPSRRTSGPGSPRAKDKGRGRPRPFPSSSDPKRIRSPCRPCHPCRRRRPASGAPSSAARPPSPRW